MENFYKAEKTYEALEAKAQTKYDNRLQTYVMKPKEYIEQHRFAFWKHLTLCSEINVEQYEKLKAIADTYDHITDALPKESIIKLTKDIRQRFLKGITYDFD